MKCLSSMPYNMRSAFDKQKLVYPPLPIYSLFTYEKGALIQLLIHKLKYKGRKDIGLFFGQLLGDRLKAVGVDFDFIVPVPLSRLRFLKREYNQSVIISEGISTVLKVPILKGLIGRRRSHSSQTKLDVWSRWLNTEEHFYAYNNNKLPNGAVVLFVDDVLTTGATLQSCVSPVVDKLKAVYACTVAAV
ncbi:MAG: ComF family protein [Bacteroidales bacterium]